eukprot:12566965-Alexandrium_andersonii.AAC.1
MSWRPAAMETHGRWRGAGPSTPARLQHAPGRRPGELRPVHRRPKPACPHPREARRATARDR